MKPWYLRCFLWLFTRLFYRITAIGPDRLPATGGALLVSNHLSFVDMLLILSSTRRFVRFVLPQQVWDLWYLNPFLRLLDIIPLPLENQSAALNFALEQASKAIRHGEVVGVFAEKNISRIGVMLPFRREFERIMKDVPAPVIPVCLDGLWGSIFSFQGGRFFWKIPRHLPYPVTVSFGAPMPPSATAPEVRAAIQALGTEAWPHRRKLMKPLGRGFIHAARQHPFRFAMADTKSKPLRFIQLLAGTILIARHLRPVWKGQKTVGILLPPSLGGALVNLAALIAGKAPVNLNYTLPAEALQSCARQANLETIISSNLLLGKLKLTLPQKMFLIEEVKAHATFWKKLSALALAVFAPVHRLEKACGCEQTAGLDDLGTVIFSSGSEGTPKGIMLSHYNLASNVEQLCQTYDFGPRDRFVGVLPLFHSFGFTATLIVPATKGLGVAYHFNPLEGKQVGDLVRRFSLTYLMSTPSLLRLYTGTCEPADFGSLTLVMAGAEKLSRTIADAFEQKFRIRPVEGYGCTECSPVVAANAHDYRACGFSQTGSRPESIGHLMPGMSLRILDLETGQPLSPGKAGLLVLRGPNVMLGYLGLPQKTAAVLHDGWYETGDLAALDEDGFLRITGRISRISKIGGEMVPHQVVEGKLNELANTQELTFAVTAVPDEARGERLVVLHKYDERLLPDFLRRLPETGLPNLWIPKAANFYRVPALPLAGLNKLDAHRLRKMAVELVHPQQPVLA